MSQVASIGEEWARPWLGAGELIETPVTRVIGKTAERT
jgi:hypothetical protein